MADREKRRGGRALKKTVSDALASERCLDILKALEDVTPRQLVNPLIGNLCSLDDTEHWRAVSAVGSIVAGLAEKDLESARVVMRRFMWQLNDESGGIGWGVPEAMAECMAKNRRLAEEFASILVSYLDPVRNFLEMDPLRKGAAWGVGRLARVYPESVSDAGPFLAQCLDSEHAGLRGAAAWALAALPTPEARDELEALVHDDEPVSLWEDGKLLATTVGELARDALSRMEGT
ncbi:MAG: DVU0298 family protein [Desulfatibacillaceae bacterium]